MKSDILFNVFQDFVSTSEYPDADEKMVSIVTEYIDHIYLDETEEGEEILVEDLTHYEVDDFLNFYLEDNFDDTEFLKKQAKDFFSRFLSYCIKSKLLPKEARKDWTEVLS
jgi:hypothetical protein